MKKTYITPLMDITVLNCIPMLIGASGEANQYYPVLAPQRDDLIDDDFYIDRD